MLAVAERASEGHTVDCGSSPLAGYCAAAAITVQACFGGCLVSGFVNDEQHFWNRLPNGREVDLTSCQFGGDGITPLKRGRKIPGPELVDPIHLAFIYQLHEEFGRQRRPTHETD
jgi:hypothetical protein